MKTSNYILLSFFIFLFGGITLLFVFSKSRSGDYSGANFKIKEKKISSFSVVVAEPGANLNLNNGDQNKMTQSYNKNAIPNFPPFIVRNDTLFVSPVIIENSKEPHLVPLTEIFCKNINSILAKEGATIYFNNFCADSINLDLHKVNLNGNIQKMSFITLNAKDSRLYLNGDGSIEKMKLQFDNTTLYMTSENGTKEVFGSLNNDSEFQGKINGKVSLYVDQLSRMYVR